MRPRAGEHETDGVKARVARRRVSLRGVGEHLVRSAGWGALGSDGDVSAARLLALRVHDHEGLLPADDLRPEDHPSCRGGRWHLLEGNGAQHRLVGTDVGVMSSASAVRRICTDRTGAVAGRVTFAPPASPFRHASSTMHSPSCALGCEGVRWAARGGPWGNPAERVTAICRADTPASSSRAATVLRRTGEVTQPEPARSSALRRSPLGSLGSRSRPCGLGDHRSSSAAGGAAPEQLPGSPRQGDGAPPGGGLGDVPEEQAATGLARWPCRRAGSGAAWDGVWPPDP